jgi:ketosteroid isomerase-like protein
MMQDVGQRTISLLLEKRARAVGVKDADSVLSSYSPDLVLYDLAPPLARSGADALQRQTLTDWFDTWRGSIDYELKDFEIKSTGDMAFAHGFVHVGGTKVDGDAVSVWTRQTLCLRKLMGEWKIVHEHTSTPFYMDGSFKAAVDLKP